MREWLLLQTREWTVFEDSLGCLVVKLQASQCYIEIPYLKRDKNQAQQVCSLTKD